jgi:hypothetical protein
MAAQWYSIAGRKLSSWYKLPLERAKEGTKGKKPTDNALF